ncbi:MAG: hypothetical protein JNM25_16890 [Planctomycetes bacterium]|nr:hypothetical protein [Planctomycetota bacterium]
MASSPTEPGSAVAFALQEVTACWDQAYEALARGDVERAATLLDIAGAHVAGAGDGSKDTPTEAALRQQAHGAFGRLQHGMKAGLAGLQGELVRVRQGAKVLRGYGDAAGAVTSRMSKDG